MIPEKLTEERLFHWMNKTSDSITVEANRRDRRRARVEELVDRYEELMQEMKDRGHWEDWCEEKGFCPTHDGWDCFA